MKTEDRGLMIEKGGNGAGCALWLAGVHLLVFILQRLAHQILSEIRINSRLTAYDRINFEGAKIFSPSTGRIVRQVNEFKTRRRGEIVHLGSLPTSCEARVQGLPRQRTVRGKEF